MNNLTEEELVELRELLEDRDVLHSIARKEEAWTIVFSSVSRVALWAVGIIGAFIALSGYLKDFLKTIIKWGVGN